MVIPADPLVLYSLNSRKKSSLIASLLSSAQHYPTPCIPDTTDILCFFDLKRSSREILDPRLFFINQTWAADLQAKIFLQFPTTFYE